MKKKLLFVFILFKFINSSAQDLYNYDNSRKFAEYLSKAGQYELATREYERLVFMRPQSDTLKTLLLSMYRRSGKLEEAVSRTRQLYPDFTLMPSLPSIEYSRTLLLKTDYKAAKDLWAVNTQMAQPDKIILSATAEILQDNYKTAKEILDALNSNDHKLAPDYKALANQAISIKRKSPALAGIMSTIIPGTGRFYTKDWKDGVVSMFFIGTMAFQSIRGFSKSGVKSTRGWIYGSVGLGFYLGNIHGSVVSAKAYNRRSHQSIKNKIENLFNSYF
ncbi:tetratricopeptide repeat protein [Emticicia sp. 17c]|uniref:tetratricopeptide repeat protein n=1 Tax=Emticicia sp. 17c TaxID=3127704 RepID=UPI00301CE545